MWRTRTVGASLHTLSLRFIFRALFNTGGGGGGTAAVNASLVGWLDPRRQVPGFSCDPASWCVLYGNPESGFRHFDNILWAWLSLFQIMTLTDW